MGLCKEETLLVFRLFQLQAWLDPGLYLRSTSSTVTLPVESLSPCEAFSRQLQAHILPALDIHHKESFSLIVWVGLPDLANIWNTSLMIQNSVQLRLSFTDNPKSHTGPSIESGQFGPYIHSRPNHSGRQKGICQLAGQSHLPIPRRRGKWSAL